MTFKQTDKSVGIWAKDKGILDNSTPLDQFEIMQGEVNELKEALEAQERNEDTYINAKGRLCSTEEEILDALGDVPVTWLVQCKMQNIDPLDALIRAYNIINKRSGRMINGKFVKDGE